MTIRICVVEPLRNPGKLPSSLSMYVFEGSMLVYPDGRLKSLQY